MDNAGTTPAAPRRSLIGNIALAVTAISAIGGVVLAIDSIVTDTDELNTFEGIFVVCLYFGWLLAVVFGVAALVRGAMTHRRGNVMAGKVALGYALLLFIGLVVWVASNQG